MIQYKSLPTHGKVIYITVVVYIVTQLWKLLGVLFCWSGFDWHNWLALSSNLNDLAFRPWTILTYMFCHADLSVDIFHIVFNMLWLWWFGQYFQRYHTGRQFVTFYITSGIFAGLFFVLCYNVFPYFAIDRYYATLVGASGAVLALITAVAIRQPDEVIGFDLIFRVFWLKMKWLAVIVIALTLLVSPGRNVGGQVCHIGGILFGLIYGLMERRGTDICAWPSRLTAAITKWYQDLRRPRMTVSQGGKKEPISADKKRDMDYNANHRQREAEIDAILDKISQSGYDNLTAEEKQLLFDASRRRGRQNN